MIIIDASMAVKLVVEESDSDIAERWLFDVRDEIGAPDLIAIEVSQAIVRRVNARDMALADGRSALQEWRAILEGGAIVQFRAEPAQINHAAEIALQLGHPVKDCVLATCGARFAARARGVYPAVKLLSDYTS